MNPKECVLVVDDDRVQADTLARVLALEGFEARIAASGTEALQALEKGGIDLVLSDLKMPGMDGMELFRRARESNPELLFMIVSAHGTIDSALEAVREGVVDFVQKPVFADELVHRFRRVFEERALRSENVALKRRLIHRERGDAMIGTSVAMERMREEIARVARTDATVLILGESGAGKELAADAIHFASARDGGPLIKLNCAAIPETLLENELFGHERGAYTGAEQQRIGRFEQADGGTLFLDEIGEISPALQVKLLRLLQERTFERLGGSEPIRADVRLLCATNQDLEVRVREGRFREDLYYRINVVPIRVPPLRDREGDIELLARHFAREAGERNERTIRDLSPEAVQRLRRHPWSGNVRELRNVIERAVIMSRGERIEADSLTLGPGLVATPADESEQSLVDRLMRSEISFEEFEREVLVRALERNRGNQSRAARMLGMTRRTLQYRIDKFDIDTAAMRERRG